jgi:hypothetical protein
MRKSERKEQWKAVLGWVVLWGLEILFEGEKGERLKINVLQAFPHFPSVYSFFFLL